MPINVDVDQKSEILESIQLMVDRYTRDKGEMWPDARAALNAAPVECAEWFRKMLGVGQIMHNRAQCPTCDEVIESLHRHDYRSCECGDSSVDGGSWYGRMGGTPKNLMENWPWIRYLEKADG